MRKKGRRRIKIKDARQDQGQDAILICIQKKNRIFVEESKIKIIIIKIMETPLAKRPRLESQNSEEIIQEQRLVIEKQMKVIENQRARIQQLEEELLRNSELSTTETNVKNVLVPELPNEIWLEIMSYLPTFEVLRNVAQVSKKFHKFSEDPHVIRKIEVESVQSWPEDEREKYCNDFLGVLKRSMKLRSLCFGFSSDIDNDTSGKKFLEALPSMNHHFLQEFCLKGDGKDGCLNASKFLQMGPDSNPLHENIVKYIEKCSDLKILKFEFKPEVSEEEYGTGDRILEHPFLDGMARIIRFKLKNLQEFHLVGVFVCEGFGMLGLNREEELLDLKIFLDIIAENFPKMQRLCLTCEDYDCNETFRAFATGKNIKVEISTVEIYIDDCSKCTEPWMPPAAIKEMKIFGPR